MIKCKSCGADMPELRLTQYGYDFCVKCSEQGRGAGRKQGVPVMMGEGDHTWIETVIMDANEYQQYLKNEDAFVEMNKTNKTKAEMLDFESDDSKTSKTLKNKENETKKSLYSNLD
jgi:hypothetical protein